MNLRDKTLSGFKWSFVDSFSKYFLSFIIGIILARLLNPSDYGLIGITSVFISISKVFIDGGFSDSLIRKLSPTNIDYSTIFIFNLILSVTFYLILFFIAPFVGDFFNEERLINIIRVVSISLIISSTNFIQRIILKKNLNFKLLAFISIISIFISGIISITMAYNGYGVWSLIWSNIISTLVTSILLWYLNKWRPQLIFKLNIIKEHFSFGSKIMAGSFFNVIYDNVYYVLIGKLFSPSELGLYSKADSFQKIISSNADIIVRQVTYPVLVTIQNESLRLKKVYQKMIKMASFFIFTSMFCMIAIAKPMIITLIGAKWERSVSYLQLLCIVGIFVPLISINANILNVKGRSDLSLCIIIFKIILSIPTLILGYYYNIHIMILGMIVSSIFIYIILLFLTNKTIKYTIKEQLLDLQSAIIFAFLVTLPVYTIGYFALLSDPIKLLLQLVVGLISFILIGEILNNNEYKIIKNIMLTKLIKRK